MCKQKLVNILEIFLSWKLLIAGRKGVKFLTWVYQWNINEVSLTLQHLRSVGGHLMHLRFSSNTILKTLYLLDFVSFQPNFYSWPLCPHKVISCALEI